MRIVPVWPRSIDDYREVVPNEVVTDLQRNAWKHPGSRILHINSTEYGGGVAEVLLAQIPLLQDLGFATDWGVIDGDERFFGITKACHNGIQGNRELEWTQDMVDHYLHCLEGNLDGLPGGYDVAVVHDPQPIALPYLLGPRRHEIAKRWVWRCHIDCSDPNPDVWAFVRNFLEPYDAVVFTMEEFVQPDVGVERVVVSPPSIDPLSPKNAHLSSVTVADICRQYKIDPRRPVIAQVSRFDPWKDPLGVIEVYHRVKEKVPDVQLLLAGSLAHDDPEGLRYYREVLKTRGNDPDLFILSNFQEVGNTAVNCFQRAARVIIQKSLREGFGLTVSEAAWKGKPVIGGDAGGITLQIEDGRTGFLVDSVDACTEKTLQLLDDPVLAGTMAQEGRELVRERFLTPRELGDWLDLFGELLS